MILIQLNGVGISEIFVNGSFATDKLHPGDVYFECDQASIASGELLRKLNEIDPQQSWTWRDEDRLLEKVNGKQQLPMWWRYRVEAWPESGQPSGQIHPLTFEPLTHAQLFRITKQGNPKGIIKITIGQAP